MVQRPIRQQELVPGLTYLEYAHDVHSLVFTAMTSEIVDIVYEHTAALDRRYAEDGMHLQYLYVLDNVPYTPYLLRRTLQAVQNQPEGLIESTAVVADTFLMRILETIVMPKIQLGRRQAVAFFTTEQEAFDWFETRRNIITP